MMKTIVRVASVALVSCLAVACGRSRVEYRPVETADCPAVEKEEFVEVMARSCRALLDFDEYLLVAANMDGYVFHLYPKAGGEKISVGRVGRGPNELVQVTDVRKYGDREFYAYDAHAGKMLWYHIDSVALGNANPYRVESVSVPDRFTTVYSVFGFGDGMRLYDGAVGLNSGLPLTRFAWVDGDGRVTESYAEYPAAADTTTMAWLYTVEPKLMAVSPDGEKMVVANAVFGAIMEMFDIGKGKIKRSATRYLIEPVIEFDEKSLRPKAGSDFVAGFADVCAADEAIYTLYYGEKITGYPRNKIVVFDWNGEVKHVYDTGCFNDHIAYDRKENCVYTVSLQEDGRLLILKYRL